MVGGGTSLAFPFAWSAWWRKVIPVILMILMKTAISLPDELFHAVNAKARALKMSRSGLLAQAAREFIERHGPQDDATEAWNRALAQAGQPADEATAAAFRARTKRVVRESWRKRR
jgi:predicted transcriptional regulator